MCSIETCMTSALMKSQVKTMSKVVSAVLHVGCGETALEDRS